MRIIIINILCLIIVFNLNAQKYDAEAIIDDKLNAYVNTVNEYSIIFSGKEESGYARYILNHPYLDTKEFRKGMMSFDGRVYPNLMLRLNLDREELIVLTPEKNFPVVIQRNMLDYAMIDSMLIFYNDLETAKQNKLPQGYYVRIYNGEHQVWKREFFTLKYYHNVRTEMADYVFEKKIWFYIFKDGVYHPVKSKGSVLNFFAAKKKELKNFIKQKDYIFRSNPESAIVAIADYYDKLSNSDL